MTHKYRHKLSKDEKRSRSSDRLAEYPDDVDELMRAARLEADRAERRMADERRARDESRRL